MDIPSLRHLAAALAFTGCTLAATPAAAVDLNWSGFAKFGYAQSDSPYTYLGAINEHGTWRADTLVAGQLDLKFNREWSATVQAQFAPAGDSDTGWHAKASWAFVAWRPDNDWLVRAGKARVPLYLFSESHDIGVAHDMVRSPPEQYSLSPTNDFTGLFVTRGVPAGATELSIDGYVGKAVAKERIWLSAGVPGQQPAGAMFMPFDVRVAGLVLTLRDTELTMRLGSHAVRARTSNGMAQPVRYPRVEIAPGLGYWQVNNALPGPGIETTDEVRATITAAGIDWQPGGGWRVTAEVLHAALGRTEIGVDGQAGYLALFKRIGAFTPYVSWARQKSDGAVLRWREQLIGSALPPLVPGAELINAAQRAAGDAVMAFDQRSTALGASYALSPTAKLKAEWMRTRVGATSAHFDAPLGQSDARGLRVDTLSVGLAVAF